MVSLLVISFFVALKITSYLNREAGRGGGQGCPSVLGRSVNLIPNRGQIMPTLLLLAPTPQILGRCAAMIKDGTQLDTHISSAPLI